MLGLTAARSLNANVQAYKVPSYIKHSWIPTPPLDEARMTYYIAKHPWISQSLLGELAEEELELTRKAVGEQITDLSVLDALRRDASATARSGIAYNPLTPFEWMKELAQDEDEHVRAAVASQAIPQITHQLANDRSALVRGWYLFNPHVSSESVAQLSRDSNPTVRQRATRVVQFRAWLDTLPTSLA